MPAANEEDAVSFVHTPAGAVPELTADGATLRVLADEPAIYPVLGYVAVASALLEPNTMAVVSEATELVATNGPARFAVVGGQPLRHRFFG